MDIILKNIILIGFAVAGMSISLPAQRDICKIADQYFEAGQYQKALDYYNQLEKINKKKKKLYRRGLCHYYTNQPDEALSDFFSAKLLGLDEDKVYYYSGKAMMQKMEYKKAADFFKDYLQKVKKKDRWKIVELIKKCQYGANNKYNEHMGFVENVGPNINSEYDEYRPVQSPTSLDKIYYSSCKPGATGGKRDKKGFKDEIYGKYYADMYAAENSQGKWVPSNTFSPLIQSPKHDITQGFSPDGKVHYFLRTRDFESFEFLADTFSTNEQTIKYPQSVISPVIAIQGDKNIQIFKKNIMLFSSKRPGGYGGYDIYATYYNDTVWSKPINLGPSINTAFDEVDPFLAKSGKKLYFSSNRIEGFGGFDIFESTFDGAWHPAKNIGLPFNSPKDDLGFSLFDDGTACYFYSDRSGTLGGYDIFQGYFKDQVNDQLMYTETLPFIDYEHGRLRVAAVDSTKTNKEDIAGSANTKKREYVFYPLFYGDDEQIMTPANISTLNSIKDAMVLYPTLRVILTGHTNKESMKEFDLYFSIKRAESAAKYLVKNGISKNRITVRGLGSNFPLVKDIMGNSSSLARKNNRRIDISFEQVPHDKVKLIFELPVIMESLKDEATETFYDKVKGLSFRVKIASTNQMLKSNLLRRYPDGTVERKFDRQKYRYYLGITDKYFEAKSLRDKLLREGGEMDYQIIPFLNGKELTPNEIETLKEVFPDLQDYLKFETKKN